MPVCKFQFLYQNWLVGELQKFKNPLIFTNNSKIVTDTSSDSVQSEKM